MGLISHANCINSQALAKIDQREKELTPQADLDKEYADCHNL